MLARDRATPQSVSLMVGRVAPEARQSHRDGPSVRPDGDEKVGDGRRGQSVGTGVPEPHTKKRFGRFIARVTRQAGQD